MNQATDYAGESATEYACHGFHDDLPGGKASGVLRISARGIDFVIGDMHGHFPLSGTHLQMGGALAALLLSQSYSRHFEEEADRVGTASLLQANINPHGLISFFENMMKEEEKQLRSLGDARAQEMAKLSSHFKNNMQREQRVVLVQPTPGEIRRVDLPARARMSGRGGRLVSCNRASVGPASLMQPGG